jgi:glycosyltransferase involved in cell wall biosynthesis
MRIALYYPWVYLTSGSERTILELTGTSRHDWTIFTNHHEPQHTFPGLRSRKIVELSPISVERTISTTARSAAQLMMQKLPLQGFDRLVVLCEGLGDLLVFRNSQIPVMCICLTPLRMAFDTTYQSRWMENRGAAQKALLSAGSFVFRLIDRLAWRKYRQVIFISTEGQRRAIAGGLVKSGQTEVVHPGFGFESATPSEEFGRFYLIPGRIMWTKNIELGIRAFRLFRDSTPGCRDFKLVIAGIVDQKSQPYFDILRQLAGSDEGIVFHVFPSDEQLAELYRTCYGTLFTAFNEDWGIVPIESMAFGKPVIAVNRGGPTESVQHGVQGFLEDANPTAFALRMAELAADPVRARAMGRAGSTRSQLYTWTRFAERIDTLLVRLNDGVTGAELIHQPAAGGGD